MSFKWQVVMFFASMPFSLTAQNSFKEEKGWELKELIPGSRVVIDLPSDTQIRKHKPLSIIFYALPNGSTVEQTAGRSIDPASTDKDEWKYDIQNIAAQTYFLRKRDKGRNYVVVYLESEQKSWPLHASKHEDFPVLYPKLIDTLCLLIGNKLKEQTLNGTPDVVLSSHSGGGRFIFSYISSVDKIPDKIKRIVFLDSNYGYESDLHARKVTEWLNRSGTNSIMVFSYIDTTVRIDGKPIVSSTGGTGYKSRIMAEDLIKSGFNLNFVSDTTFSIYYGPLPVYSESRNPLKIKGTRIRIMVKENPEGRIYHTVLVERNGFVHSLLAGGRYENRGYLFWGKRCYRHSR
jgi:hypothetical protein